MFAYKVALASPTPWRHAGHDKDESRKVLSMMLRHCIVAFMWHVTGSVRHKVWCNGGCILWKLGSFLTLADFEVLQQTMNKAAGGSIHHVLYSLCMHIDIWVVQLGFGHPDVPKLFEERMLLVSSLEFVASCLPSRRA